jgi:hypothetical protein
MHKDSDLFVYFLDLFDKKFGRKGVNKLVNIVSRLDKLLEEMPQTAYHLDKATYMHRLVNAYAGGFWGIERSCKIRAGDDFDWLAEQYGSAIQVGSSDVLWGIEYLSFESGKGNSAILALFPDDMEHDSYVRTYEMALQMPGSHLKKRFNVVFQNDRNRINSSTAQPYRNIYIKMKAKK